ncbi:MAG: prolipoprotein diacylglyceryl transferase [Candidatus Aminicenantes bacterium]|nr:prolipoprotein diacylglyceryl transferase [Candidatus Aminicenantes bacterium]
MLPEVFRIFSRSVSGYEFFYVLGLAAAAWTILRLSRREGLDTVEVAAFVILGIFCGLLGSRMLAPLATQLARLPFAPFDSQELRRDMATGGSLFGGAFALLLFALLYSRTFFRGKRWQLLDVSVIGIALGQGIGRLGCFAAGCCFGIPTSLPWGVSFPWLGRSPHPMAGTPLHPVQLYEAALCLANALLLYVIWRRRRFPGQVTCLFLVNYGLIRFSLEFLRHHGPGEMIWPGGLSWYQACSLLLLLAGWLCRRRWKKIGLRKKCL